MKVKLNFFGRVTVDTESYLVYIQLVEQVPVLFSSVAKSVWLVTTFLHHSTKQYSILWILQNLRN